MWADPYRAHDPLVLHWLVNLGFECLMTDFSVPVKDTALASCTTLPPDGRMDFQQAKLTWEAFWRGQLALRQLSAPTGQRGLHGLA